MYRYLFLAHAGTDIDEVESWDKVFHQNGMDTFLAERDLRNDLDDALANAVYNCDVFVCFLSPQFITCDWCKREVTWAQNRKKPVFAIALTDFEFAERCGLHLSDRQVYDVRDQGFEEAIVHDLREALQLPVSAQRPIVVHHGTRQKQAFLAAEKKNLLKQQKESKEEGDENDHEQEYEEKDDDRQQKNNASSPRRSTKRQSSGKKPTPKKGKKN